MVEIPPSNHGIPGSRMLQHVDLPEITSMQPEPTDPQAVASAWLEGFNHLITGHDQNIKAFFLDASYWRDLLCTTWNFHTYYGSSKIMSVLKGSDQKCRVQLLELDLSSDIKKPTLCPIDFHGSLQGVQAFLKVETKLGRGRGLVKLVQDARDGGKWKAFILFTTLEQLEGHEESINARRPTGVEHGSHPGRLNWQERRLVEANCEGSYEPTVLIIGAGQGGLTIAARLKQLSIPTLIIDRNERIGDNWRNRYHQLVLHDSVWYDHMPYLNFPPNWPIFTPKDKLAEWFDTYAKALELNVWTKTSLTSSTWDEGERQWTLTVKRQSNGRDETRTLHPRHVIQATGHSGEPYFPSHIKGLDSFKGDRLVHSSQFTGPQPNTQGKKAVIVGCCNSGHDIAQDYYEHGYEVTMVQRSSTLVVSCENLIDVDMKGVYSESGPPIEDADILSMSTPNAVGARLKVDNTKETNRRDAPLLRGLQAAGFALDNGPEGAGLFAKYLHRGGGYYIDVGASQLIAEEKIKIKQGQEIERVNPHSLTFADGSELEADEIVFATGYQNMRETARKIFGDKLADRVKDVWGFDDEGETRTMWRRTGHPGFWFFGGNLALCRFYSRLLALQIKALELGLMKYEID
ncbi:MAG: hypothetical protein LQ337_004544 [Flavoplaca oasis]|nr:MAG: hypothetical protein LQ337_004544 [Flavoplaca oasis]